VHSGVVFVHDYDVWLTPAQPESDRQSMTQAVALRIAEWLAPACGGDDALAARDRHGRDARPARRIRREAPAP
jgi:hypothetical protein